MTTARTILVSALTAIFASALTAIVVVVTAPRWMTMSESSKNPEPAPVQQTETGETITQPRSFEEEIVDVVKSTEPAVVSVVISKDVPVIERYYDDSPDNNFQDPFFSPFQFRVPQYRQNGTQKQEIGGGSAFFISSDGLLMTNKHVVDDPKAEYTILMNDGRKLTATVIARDTINDIALLKVDGKNFPYLELSAEDEPLLGQTAIAIGNSLGEFRNTVSIGVISGVRRSINAGTTTGSIEHLTHIIQTDAAINQGNSGGPLLASNGKVIGMNTAVAGGAQNIAFAIPAGDLRRVLQSYTTYGRIVRPYVGIRYVPVTEEMQRRNSLGYNYGALVSRGNTIADPGVLPDSPASKAGIVEGDIILEVDGEKLTEETSLASLIQRKKPGDVITMKISHGGQEKMVRVTVEELKEP